jgi:hypothetical protein
MADAGSFEPEDFAQLRETLPASIEAELDPTGPSAERAFVEIGPALVDQAVEPVGAAVWMELKRPDALRLRIRPTHGVDLLALVERFLGV